MVHDEFYAKDDDNFNYNHRPTKRNDYFCILN